jgi:mannose-6-phosphate isomerase-like protein (cupin superfamily)
MDADDNVRDKAVFAAAAGLVERVARLAAGGQTASCNHFECNDDFKANGLRPYARYRDLGVASATGGLVHAHVIRMLPPCPDEARKVHFHATVFQMIYVLKGWLKVSFEGQEPQIMRAGTCWTQPPGIKHAVLDYSDDFEALEVLLPADFETVTVAS